LRGETATLREQLQAGQTAQLELKQQLANALNRISALVHDSSQSAQAAKGASQEKDTVMQSLSVQDSVHRARLQELQEELDRARDAAKSCPNCRQLRDKYEHLARQQLDATKLREDGAKLRKKLDAVTKQLLVARRVNEMNEQFMSRKTQHLDDELRNLSTSLERTRVSGGAGAGGGAGSAGGPGSPGPAGGGRLRSPGGASINASTGSMAGLGGVNTSVAGI
jgi:hypothetical protein